jgi:chromosome segregation ATPase
MKKLLLIFISMFTFLILQGQVANQESNNYSEDLAVIKKSIATMQKQLKDQKLIISKQNIKIDSLNNILKHLNTEIQENTSYQVAYNKSVNDLYQRINNVNNALAERKLYAIITFVIAVLVVLLIFYFSRKTFLKLKKIINQKEDELNEKIKNTNDKLTDNINKNNELIHKNYNELIDNLKNIQNELETKISNLQTLIDEKNRVLNMEFNDKLSLTISNFNVDRDELKENLNNMKASMNNEINLLKSSISLINNYLDEQRMNLTNLNSKLVEFSSDNDKKIAIIHDELNNNINEIHEKINEIIIILDSKTDKEM